MIKHWNGNAGWTRLDRHRARWPCRRPRRRLPRPPPPPDGEVGIETGLRCTPPGGRLRVNVTVRKPKGGEARACRRIVFFTKGKGRTVRVDRKAPFVVRIRINRPGRREGPRVRPRLLPPVGEGEAAPQDGFPPLHGVPLASLAACATTSASSDSAGSASRSPSASPTRVSPCSASTTTPERLATLRERRMPFKEPGTDELIARVDARPLEPRRRRREGRRDRAHARHPGAAARRDRHGRDPRRARRPAAGAAPRPPARAALDRRARDDRVRRRLPREAARLPGRRGPVRRPRAGADRRRPLHGGDRHAAVHRRRHRRGLGRARRAAVRAARRPDRADHAGAGRAGEDLDQHPALHDVRAAQPADDGLRALRRERLRRDRADQPRLPARRDGGARA